MRKELTNSNKCLTPVHLLFAIISLIFATTALAEEPFLEMPSAPAASSGPWSIVGFILTGLLLGTIGQTFRVFVGIKKERTAAKASGKKWNDWFDGAELGISLLFGAGVAAVVALSLSGTAVDAKFYLACLTAGYAGSDFLQSFFSQGESTVSNSTTARAITTEGGAAKAGN